ncbi:universal stress protein [Geodermatophilus sp. SYSU D00779]
MASGATGTGTAGRADGGCGAPGSARIVVGVDGSPGASAALLRALAEAARPGADVGVVNAFAVDDQWDDPLPIDARRIETLRSDTEARARASVARAMSDPAVTAVPRAAAVEVSSTVVAGEPAAHLVHRPEGAELLVVGSRSRSRLAGMVLGSVALHRVVLASCPVLVRPEPSGVVVPEQAAGVPARV